ncbi:hypothetical protein Bp8pC_144 [Bacillus phage Bp8p-C]|uniref:Uncharacterized protein n=2 Tax=Agatevirus Bp8pC TaxID=1910937 RepID=A0A0A0PQQ8_9CAUD|nr:hypothetical protein AXJ20_gp204 [Bacillus phage Bp8p-C]YP_009784444.1 hypothetical protein QLX39_gp204 [Bacillus phage Bp8p-T]AHJ87574.1 hypothetical protein Bp8pC_144 [Bacillus phage Bp8p-C]AHJ87785.1 hypothetical protein Bp8pT_144 [Bacillus phage Bp8p-T]
MYFTASVSSTVPYTFNNPALLPTILFHTNASGRSGTLKEDT